VARRIGGAVKEGLAIRSAGMTEGTFIVLRLGPPERDESRDADVRASRGTVDRRKGSETRPPRA
jgi:hypothetical protein